MTYKSNLQNFNIHECWQEIDFNRFKELSENQLIPASRNKYNHSYYIDYEGYDEEEYEYFE